MRCSKCGTENKETAKFCRACGATLADEQKEVGMKPKCKFCGTELDSNVKFCKHCGRPVQNAPKNSNKKKGGWRIFGVILVAVLLIWIFIAVDYIIDGRLVIFSLGEKTTEAMKNNGEQSMPKPESSQKENLRKSEEETKSEEDDKADSYERKQSEIIEDNSELVTTTLETTESLKETTTISQTTEPMIQSYPVVNSTVLENGNTYELYDISLSWTEAKEYCEKKGGHLVTITSQEEQNVVTSLLRVGMKKYYWIGATDEREEGKWQWVTGEAFTYTNWCQDPLQPDNHSGIGGIEEDYAELLQVDGTWMDLQERGDAEGDSHLSYAGFICEYEL